MKLRLKALIAVYLIALSAAVQAQSITPEQLQMFKNLPPAQQSALAKQYGVDPAMLEGTSSAQAESMAAARLPEKRNATEAQEVDLANKSSAAATGALKRFGIDVFATQPETFAPLNNVPVADNYRIGPGDSVNVQLYGKENDSFELNVDPLGSINFPTLGPISVAGLTFAQVEQLISQRIEEQKIGVRSNITMGTLRSIEIFVLGDAFQPGKYLVSSLSTITHVLYASGGVNEQGSLRDIRLLRNGELIGRFDIYDLLINGDTSGDLQLRSGDVIFVAPLGKTASIDGEVVRPAIYELLGKESINDLVTMAGGYTTKAYKSSVNFERVTGEGFIDLQTLNLNSNSDLATKLHNGDFLTISKIVKHTKNYVSVKGNVVREGRFQWKQGLHIADLFPSIHRSLNKSSDLNYSLVIRRDTMNRVSVLQINLGNAITDKLSDDNIKLQAEDEILVFTKFDLVLFSSAFSIAEKEKDILSVDAAETKMLDDETAQGQNKTASASELDKEFDLQRASKQSGVPVDEIKKALASTREKLLAPLLAALQDQSTLGHDADIVEIFGEVKFPGVYPITDRNSVNDLIDAAGGLNQAAYMLNSELTRVSIYNSSVDLKLLRLNLAEVIQNNPAQNVALQARDRLNVLTIPNLRKQRTVSLQGEVRFPGTYVLKRGETLSGLVARAGGLTEFAHQDGAIFTREALRIREQQQVDAYAESIRQEVAKKSFRQQSGAGGFSSSSTSGEQLGLIDEMSSTKALGRMVIDLPGVLHGDAAKDFMLEDQDLLYIPQYRKTVSIMGEVQISTSYLLDESLNFKDYINFAGGAKKQADLDRVFIVRANGSVYKPESGFWFKNNEQPLQPGDTIVVPVDTDYRDTLTTWTAVTQIMYQIGIAANALK